MLENRNFKKIILILLLVTFMVLPVEATTVDEIEKAKQGLDNTQSEIGSMQESRNQLEELQTGLENELQELMPRCIQLEELIKVKEEEIAVTQTELDEAQATADDQYFAMKKRIQYLYENGSTSFLEMIMSADNITDALKKAEFAESIAVYDKEKLEEYTAALQAVSDRKKTLKAEEEDLLVVKKELDDQNAAINASIEATSLEIAQYNNDLATAQTLAQEYESTVESLREQLRQEALSLNTLGENSAFNSTNIISDPENYVSKGEFKLTFYCSCVICSENYGHLTSTGTTCIPAQTIAVDPSIIPYGSQVMIGGHVFLAEDTGGAIKGNRIDVFVSSHAEANALGVAMAEVFIKNK